MCVIIYLQENMTCNMNWILMPRNWWYQISLYKVVIINVIRTRAGVVCKAVGQTTAHWMVQERCHADYIRIYIEHLPNSALFRCNLDEIIIGRVCLLQYRYVVSCLCSCIYMQLLLTQLTYIKYKMASLSAPLQLHPV